MNAPTIDTSVTGISATYDPADNKIRLRSLHRLPRELYDRVRAAGFIWAPKQDLFVAPMWTPAREDLAVELAGELGDEDTSLVNRAEDRAERFEAYGEKRAEDAERAHAAVERIADGIPLGQPILVGHHSERRARKDAEKIRNGMTRAVKLWETSKYWERRAKGALRLAKYKELPGVRHRRIKGLEADLRKHTKNRDLSMQGIKAWSSENLKTGDWTAPGGQEANAKARERALFLANYDHAVPSGTWSALEREEIAVEEAARRAVESHTRLAEHAERWISHLTNRLAYERAMLDEAGDIVARREGFDVKPGGQVEARHGWAVVVRVNTARGVVNSYTVAGRYGKTKKIGIEEVTDYRPPTEEDAAKVAKATKLPPLVNFPGGGFRSMSKADWDARAKHSDSYRTVRVKATEAHGAYRQRTAWKGGGDYTDISVYITDMPRKDPPPPDGPRPELPERIVEVPPRSAGPDPYFAVDANNQPVPREHLGAAIAGMKASLKAGVQVVSADQLFPTPPALAQRMVGMAGASGIRPAAFPGARVLEPSAGTGNLVKALQNVGANVTAYEIDPQLAPLTGATCVDFLDVTPTGDFDAVIMNPPFKDGADIEHILHARKFLRPGGTLVAICAGGPRQEKALRPLAGHWEELPAGTFAGTNVRAVLLVMGAS